jgi:hypothetical protein
MRDARAEAPRRGKDFKFESASRRTRARASREAFSPGSSAKRVRAWKSRDDDDDG